MALNRSPEVKAVIVQIALLAILFYFSSGGHLVNRSRTILTFL